MAKMSKYKHLFPLNLLFYKPKRFKKKNLLINRINCHLLPNLKSRSLTDRRRKKRKRRRRGKGRKRKGRNRDRDRENGIKRINRGNREKETAMMKEEEKINVMLKTAEEKMIRGEGRSSKRELTCVKTKS